MPSLSELSSADFDSEYLCNSCRSPLYEIISSGLDTCLNSNCTDWPIRYSAIVDFSEQNSPRIHQQLAMQKDQILEKVRSCNISSLRRFAHEVRKRLSQGFIETRAMRISEWQAVAELLVMAQSVMLSDECGYSIEKQDFFDEILAETSTWSKTMLNF